MKITFQARDRTTPLHGVGRDQLFVRDPWTQGKGDLYVRPGVYMGHDGPTFIPVINLTTGKTTALGRDTAVYTVELLEVKVRSLK